MHIIDAFVLFQSLSLARCFSSKANNPRRRGFLRRRITGDSTPYKFPVQGPLKFRKKWPENFPYEPSELGRIDSSPDGIFYSLPRPVYHMDEPAVAALTQYYRHNIPANSDILDICSSWVSHFPLEFPETMKSIAATGMNAMELSWNDQLTAGYTVTDLNQQKPGTLTALPYDNESFDVITCACSFDYLIKPVEVLRECHRVLRPGGRVIISFSNRCFIQKAVRLWRIHNSAVHLELLNGYFQYAGGFQPRLAFDITAKLPNDRSKQDPMFVVQADKI